MGIAELRREYHRHICEEIIRLQRDDNDAGYLNFADKGNKVSRVIAQGIVDRICDSSESGKLAGQTAGNLFETFTRDFGVSDSDGLGRASHGE